MLLQQSFETLKKSCGAKFLRTEDLSETGYLFHWFELAPKLFIIVRFNLKTNKVEAFDSVDDIDWDNDRALLCPLMKSETDIIEFCLKAVRRQLRSLR